MKKSYFKYAVVLFLSMLLVPLKLVAQNVTIKATNGSMIASVKDGGTTDAFFNHGGFATWQHNQLSMALTAADDNRLTDAGLMANPANNLFSSGNYIQIGKGQASGANTCYLSLSLPKGYRFTGYTIKFSKPARVNKGGWGQAYYFNADNASSRFGETDASFGTYVTYADAARSGAAQTISRTEMTEGEMGNILYFKLMNPSNDRVLITLESAEFFFTAEADYTPLTPTTTVSNRSAVDIPFSTSKVDYGTIQRRTYNGQTRVSYSSANVKDLTANFVMYEAESVTDGSDFDGVEGKVVEYKAGTISSENGYFRVGRSSGQEQVYYIETPTYVTLSNGVQNPVGYRVIGASFDYARSGDNDYTLYVYDKTGTDYEAVDVNSENPSGTVTLAGLNNDAVKFGIEGIGLIKGTLTLQALDPYLDHMSVVCQDEVQTQVRLSQTFTASDFSVSGGTFYFYLPADCEGHQVAISFEDLKSKYFDETYTGGSSTHTSRINFVKSDHYNAFDGTAENIIYNNPEEAANAELERLKVDIVGTAKFRFNNADELSSQAGTLTEYPFSLENYAAAPNNGSFSDMKYVVSTEDQNLVRYVFTTDETRYNIAPTTAVQHRAYAYYEMDVHVQTSTYEPKVEFTKIYDHTLYGTGQDSVFYGAKVTAYDNNTPPKAGYSSTAVIFEKIEEAIQRGTDDFGNACADLKHSTQLLYLDFSEMAGIYQTTDDTHGSMEDFAATNAKNCIIFIPVGASAPNNNVCYKTEGGTFMAAHDIVLTDKEPFYTPYDIYMSGTTSKVSYKRAITKDKYGKVQNASLILPFVVALTDGKHTNSDGTSFTMHTMQKDGALKMIEDTTFAYFPTLDNVAISEANKPYLVHLDENSSEDGISFVVDQPGSTIYATPTSMAADYTFTGETATGVHADEGDAVGTYTFTSTGTYAGQRVPKTDNIFYFAKNQFVCSKDLITSGYVNIAPFRAYYKSTSTANPARLSLIEVIFGEGEGDTDAIRSLKQKSDLAVKAGRGTLTIAAKADSQVTVSGVNGVSHYSIKVQAGDVKTVSVPAGVYVVNGVKILVK